ncbi:MAG TPA: SelL-related redox protein [Tepidisphaeraceae bacterium]|jgi:hypothetical protein
MPHVIANDILGTPVDGLNLHGGDAGGTLGDQMGDRATLLVFLRHFGCMFCRETVRDLRRISADHPDYPPILFFCHTSVDEGRSFFAEYWPEARAVADPAKRFYTALGLRKATLNQLVGVRVWTCGFRAMSKGNFVGKPIGDPWIMPGAFLVHGGEIVWSHRFRHQGDNPDWMVVLRHVPTGAAVHQGDQ